MRFPRVWVFVVLSLLAAALAGCVDQQQIAQLQAEKAALQEQNRQLKELAGPLPASLDNYFPPKAPAPVWLIEMLGLSSPLESIGVDLQQGDIAGAKANYAAFKTQYGKVAGMVPEWKERFPMAPVENLGKALESGDPGQVGQAVGAVGQVCGGCHLVNQSKAFFKYHWPDFEALKLNDPVSKESVVWVDYMRMMAGAFTGIGNDLQQGQVENALQNYDAFSARLKALEQEGCAKCHSTARTYFVDPASLALVDQLGQALKASPPDAQSIIDLSGAIGNEVCMKCHLVHVPAASARAREAAFADLFK
jgi:cytochrome c556